MSDAAQMRVDAGRLEEMQRVLGRKQKLDAKEVAYLEGRVGPVLERVIARYRGHADKLDAKGQG